MPASSLPLSPRPALTVRSSARRGAARQRQSPRVRSERRPFLHEAALEGLGITMLPAYLVLDDLRSGRLVRVLPEHWVKDLGDKLFVLTIPNRYPSASVRALTEFLRGHLKPMGRFWAPTFTKLEEDRLRALTVTCEELRFCGGWSAPVKGLMLCTGTAVDATSIAAPSSQERRRRKRSKRRNRSRRATAPVGRG